MDHSIADDDALRSTGAPVLGPAPRKSSAYSAVLAAGVIHSIALIVLASIFLASPDEPEPALILQTFDHSSKDEVKRVTQVPVLHPQPSSPSAASLQLITAQTAAPVAVPVIDLPLSDQFAPGVETGTGFGAGFGEGIGTGANQGFGMQFFGNRSKANSVVFVVDASGSMNAERQDVMRKELSRAVGALTRDALYQIIFFSGPAWAHDRFGTRAKDMRSAIRSYETDEFNEMYESGKYKPIKLRRATRANIRESISIIENIPMSFGTRWSPGIEMALLCEPTPDVIYFMTDGSPNRKQEELSEALDRIRRARKRAGSKTKIFATALMEPRAANQMEELAKSCRGEFNVVMPGDQNSLILIKGKDWMRGKREGELLNLDE